MLSLFPPFCSVRRGGGGGQSLGCPSLIPRHSTCSLSEKLEREESLRNGPFVSHRSTGLAELIKNSIIPALHGFFHIVVCLLGLALYAHQCHRKLQLAHGQVSTRLL